jgi:hypothetical protein
MKKRGRETGRKHFGTNTHSLILSLLFSLNSKKMRKENGKEKKCNGTERKK